MKYIVALLMFAGLFHAPHAWAQCAAGVDTGGQCIPPEALPGADQQTQPTRPQAVWATRWGAIAVDGSTGQVGVAENETSKSLAQDNAVQRCAAHGGQGCKVEQTYANACVALAWGKTFHEISSAVNASVAQESALTNCAKGAPDCKLVYRACSVAQRVQ